MTVAVVGCSGYIGGRLIQRLDDDPRIDRVLGFDVRPPMVEASKLLFDHVDMRDQELARRFEGVDVVVHLAFIMDPIKDETLMRDVNVSGSHNVFDCAARAGVDTIVYTSSGTVYGAHPNNDVPLTETSPLRANLDFSYPAHKLEVEYVIKEFRRDHPDIRMVVFRPAIVFGPHVDNAWSHVLELPVVFGVRGHEPPMQFVHEDDVARALDFAVMNDLDGVYNLTPDDSVAAEQLLDILGRRRVMLDEPTAFALAERLWSAGMSEAPAGMLHYLMHPWIMSPDKLRRAGFECERSSASTFREATERARSYVRLGRSRVRKVDLARGAAAGVTLAGALAAYRTVRARA